MSANDLSLILWLSVGGQTFAGEDREVVAPEVHHPFPELPWAVDSPEDESPLHLINDPRNGDVPQLIGRHVLDVHAPESHSKLDWFIVIRSQLLLEPLPPALPKRLVIQSAEAKGKSIQTGTIWLHFMSRWLQGGGRAVNQAVDLSAPAGKDQGAPPRPSKEMTTGDPHET